MGDIPKPLLLSHKELHHLFAHLNPVLVRQVEHVIPGLRLSPLIPAVSLKDPVSSIHHPGGGPSTQRVEPWHALPAILAVEDI